MFQLGREDRSHQWPFLDADTKRQEGDTACPRPSEAVGDAVFASWDLLPVHHRLILGTENRQPVLLEVRRPFSEAPFFLPSLFWEDPVMRWARKASLVQTASQVHSSDSHRLLRTKKTYSRMKGTPFPPGELVNLSPVTWYSRHTSRFSVLSSQVAQLHMDGNK